jgi:anthranilate synthase component 1
VRALGPREALALSRTLEACPDPVRLYATLCSGRSGTLLLESADQSTKSGEKSLVVTRAALRLTCRGDEVVIAATSPNGASLLPALAEALGEKARTERDERTVRAVFARPRGSSERERLAAPSVLDAVRATVLGLRVVGAEAALPPLCAGSFAYDLVGAYEDLPEAAADPLGWPDFELWLAEEVAWIHHARRRTVLLRWVFGGAGAEAAYHDAARGIEALEAICREQKKGPESEGKVSLPPKGGGSGREEPAADLDDTAYAAVVTHLKRHITAGDVFQIVPSRTFSAPCPDPLAAYARLRALDPSPYMFFVAGERGILFGASPESALTVRAGRVAICPIAGTRARGRRADGSIDPDLDARTEAELRLDHKELAEHMMLVDLARNDVARVSRAGTRAVSRLCDVVRYSRVMHLTSEVEGTLRPDLDALHAYVATMNMGTLVGAPKVEAQRLLRRYERSRRGPYGGAVGYLTAAGGLDTCIVIRSAAVQHGIAHVRAGAGVVYDSVPEAEAAETRRKADAVLAALAQAGVTSR